MADPINNAENQSEENSDLDELSEDSDDSQNNNIEEEGINFRNPFRMQWIYQIANNDDDEEVEEEEEGEEEEDEEEAGNEIEIIEDGSDFEIGYRRLAPDESGEPPANVYQIVEIDEITDDEDAGSKSGDGDMAQDLVDDDEIEYFVQQATGLRSFPRKRNRKCLRRTMRNVSKRLNRGSEPTNRFRSRSVRRKRATKSNA